MSLKAWYPFDGNIKNHGTGSEKIAAYGTVTYNAGKVTDKSFATGATYLKSQYGHVQNDKLTIAMWVNPNTTTLWTDIISYGSGNNRIELSDASGRYTWYCNDSTALCASGTHLFTIPVNTWHHIAVTADGSKVCFYLDGALTLEKAQKTSVAKSFGTMTEYRLGCRYTNGSSLWAGSINDFRMYDECLSPREVKQLARGLAIHYKLDLVRNANLITTMSAGGRTTLVGKYGLNADYAQNADTYGRFNVSPALEFDKQYTLSFDVFDFPPGATWTWQLWNRSAYSFSVKGNGHYSYTFTPIAANMPSDYSLSQFLFDDGTRGSIQYGTVKFRNFKIEEGTSDTGWCPHDTDTTMKSLRSSTTEIDYSGYHKNGTQSGAHKSSDDSARYKKSRVFDNSQYITATHTGGSDVATISAWLKVSSYPTGSVVAFADQSTKIAFGFYNNGSAIISCGDASNTTGIPSGIKTSWTVDDWHMVTIVKSGSTYKFYLDGRPWSSYGAGNYWTMSLTNTLTIGCRNNGSYNNFYSGQISDLRVYHTALSDSDVAELYNVATSYTEQGSLLTHEINEIDYVSNIKFGRSETKAEDFSEIGYIGGMKVKTLSDKSAWARIHWLDVTTLNEYYASNDEVAFCNKPNRFSRMGLVDHFRGHNLPKDYTQLEYIESNGTQYINTGYYWTSEAVKIEMDAIITNNSSSQSLFGNEEKYSGGDRYFCIIPHGSNGTFNIYTGTSGGLGNVALGLNTRVLMECETTAAKNLTVKVNGESKLSKTYAGTVMSYANTSATDASKGLIYIFSNHNSASGAAPIQNVGGMKLYSFKMWDNGNLVRDFVPCKNKSGQIGLYDRANEVFYLSPNGTAFIAGPAAADNNSSEGIFEFMLTHPKISATGYNRWTQTSSPNDSTVTGFHSLHCSWDKAHGGIRKHGGSCIYDCDTGSSWYAPIGQTAQWTTGKYIPAADESSTTETELWVRIDTLSNLNKISMLENKYLQAFEIKEL